MNTPAPVRTARSREHDLVAHAFRAAGAVSPAGARALHELPTVDAAAVLSLAARGVVREAAPGQYYWYPGGLHDRRERVVRSVLIAACSGAVLVGLPLLAWLLTR